MVIFVLRHADRTPPDEGLSPAGVRRARLLGRMLAGSGASVAYCSDASRTRQTLAPLKQKLGKALAIKEFSTEGPGGVDAHVKAVVKAIKALPVDAVAVVVSHSNTVGSIIAKLGGDAIADIGDDEFDKLFVLFRPADGPAALLKLHY